MQQIDKKMKKVKSQKSSIGPALASLAMKLMELSDDDEEVGWPSSFSPLPVNVNPRVHTPVPFPTHPHYSLSITRGFSRACISSPSSFSSLCSFCFELLELSDENGKVGRFSPSPPFPFFPTRLGAEKHAQRRCKPRCRCERIAPCADKPGPLPCRRLPRRGVPLLFVRN